MFAVYSTGEYSIFSQDIKRGGRPALEGHVPKHPSAMFGWHRPLPRADMFLHLVERTL